MSRSRARYVLVRVASALLIVFFAITMNFVLFRLAPGDPTTLMSRVPSADSSVQEALRHKFALDKSVFQQYVAYLSQLLHGNLGISFADQRPVAEKLKESIVNTVPMVAIGTILGMLAGIASGVVAAWRRGGAVDHSLVGVSLVFYALPAQWVGLMLIVTLSGSLPSGGMTDPFLIEPSFADQAQDYVRHLILPVTTIMLLTFGQFTVLARSSMLETLGEDYVLTARAKGLRNRAIVLRHAFRNAMLPVVTLIGLSLGGIVAGSILVETVFSWPGIGRATYDAVIARDYPMLQGVFLVFTLAVVICNLLADLLYARLDPRVTA